MTVIAVLNGAVFLAVAIRSKMLFKGLFKLGLIEQPYTTDWTATVWEKYLRTTGCKADVVFLGDSITAGGNFQICFEDLQVLNLGVPGDSIPGLCRRVSMVQLAAPGRVFVLGGINGLTNFNQMHCVRKYRQLMSQLREAVPSARLYIQSVLPVSAKKEWRLICSNRTIRSFNRELKRIAADNQAQYIDLYSLYAVNGRMKPEYSTDGVHLKREAYALWIEEIQNCLRLEEAAEAM